MNNKKAIIILSGYNQRAVIAFCRFATQKGIEFFIMAKSETDEIFETAFKKNVVFVRKGDSLEINIFKQTIALVKKNHLINEFLILPSSEGLNRFLLKNVEKFKEIKIEVPLVNEKLYSSISDKYLFGELCKQNKLKVPKEFNKLENVYFPFVAKPRYYSSKTTLRQLKPYLIFAEADLKNFKNNEIDDDFYYQEYIDGKSFYLLYHLSKNGKCTAFSQENLLQQVNGGSILVAKYADLFKKEICKRYIELFKSIDFFGLVMVELKFRNKDFIMIEANPRLWGPSQYFLDAGSRIFDCFLEDNGFEIEKTVEDINSACYYFWNGGIILNDNSLTFHNYSSEQFLNDYPKLMQNDIYLRTDTVNLYLREITKTGK